VSTCTQSAQLLSLTLAMLVGCASAEHYDSATKGPAKPTASAGGISDTDTDTDTDSSSTGFGEATSESQGSGEAPSESQGSGEATSESGDPTGSPTGNQTWTTTTQGGSTTDDCGGPCDTPPSSCYDMIGECSGTECLYYPLDGDSACDDGDACTDNDVCDGDGGCAGEVIECVAGAHASGGSCVDGACQGFTCEDPWENCDGDWDNGCEVPTGIANQCDINGLNPDGGCWTAYCGSSDDPKAYDFGDFFCFDCSTCHQATETMVQWCNHDTGNWYPPEVNTCGAYLDLVCGPP